MKNLSVIIITRIPEPNNI